MEDGPTIIPCVYRGPMPLVTGMGPVNQRVTGVPASFDPLPWLAAGPPRSPPAIVAGPLPARPVSKDRASRTLPLSDPDTLHRR